MRALWFASIANGSSTIRAPLHSNDSRSMINACRQFGASICEQGNDWRVTGFNGQPQANASCLIDCGNSGLVLRLCSAFAALNQSAVIFDGDTSIRQRRCMQAVIDGIKQFGGHAHSLEKNDRAPLTIQGPCHSRSIQINGRYAQPITALLMIASQLNGLSRIDARPVSEPSWVNMTLAWFDRLIIQYSQPEAGVYEVSGRQHITAFDLTIPGDFSQAAFALIGAIIHRQPLTLHNLDFTDAQGDKQLFTCLQQQGIALEISTNSVHYDGHTNWLGGTIDVSDFNDCVPVLAVLACYATSPVRIIGAENCRHKESNRLQAISKELKKMGASIIVNPDGLIVEPKPLHACDNLFSHHDHRIAMALCVASSRCDSGASQVHDCNVINKSYPAFMTDMQTLGMDISA